jgi:hypothetical protein
MTQPNVEPQDPGNQGTGQNDPPYASYLNQVPEAMRGVVEPAFKAWDANVTQMRQQDVERLSQYQPYEQFINEYEPDAIEMAIQLASVLETQPELVFNNLAQSLGYEIAGNEIDDEDDNGAGGAFNLANSPEFQQLQGQLGEVAEFLQSQQQVQQDQAEIAQVQSELKAMETKYGDFDVEYVLTKASITGNLEAAVQEYQNKVGAQAKQLLVPGQQAPVVGGSNGSMPSNTEDRGKWTTEQRNEAALAILRAANQQT